jgi:tRNA A-37 threonylcarbamoyl transferase component Bud32
MSHAAEPDHESLPLDQRRRVHNVCKHFEAAWQSGERPRPEDYLGDAPAPEATALLRELVLLDIEYRRRLGEHPRVEDYRDRFSQLDAAWLTRELMAPTTPPRSNTLPDESLTAEPLPSDGPPGDSDTRYQLVRFHAKGGLGDVFVAQDGKLHRTVALKRIQEGHADDAEHRRRFLREAEITARLEHPGIVPVHDLIDGGDGRPGYAMRFIQGETLADAIERYHTAPPAEAGERRLALRQLLNRFVAVCNTVAYAHSRGILHRDLKPANIMLGKYGETLVVDLGSGQAVCARHRSPVLRRRVAGPAGGQRHRRRIQGCR